MNMLANKDSSCGDFGSRLTECSLLAATQRLEHALEAAPVADPWYSEVHAAIQACTLAVEHHLDALDAADGMKHSIGSEEPRLIPRLERLDADLNRLLLEFWGAKEAAVHPRVALAGPLGQLARELRTVADGEIDLIHESLVPIGAED